MRYFKVSAVAFAVVLSATFLLARQSGPSLTGWQTGGPYPLTQILSGSILPLTVKAADLPPSYGTVHISEGGFSWLDIASMSLDSNPDPRVYQSLLSFTAGDIITVDGFRYYVTYKKGPIGGMAQVSAGADNMSLGAPQSADLHLELVKVDSVVMITPMPEARKAFVQSSDAATIALSRAKQLGLAVLMYANDYDDYYPYAQSTDEAKTEVMPYVKNKEIFESPTPGGRFLYNTHLSGVNASQIATPATTPLWKEALPDPKQRFAVAYTDGHAKMLGDESRPQLEAAWMQRYAVPPPAKPVRTKGHK